MRPADDFASTTPAPAGCPGSPAPPPRLALHLGLLAATAASLTLFGWAFEGMPTSAGPLGEASSFGGAIAEIARALWHDPAALSAGVPYALAVLAILGSHEMGHYLACRRYGVPATLPYFLPGIAFGTFGAVIRIRGRIPSRRALFDIAVAGPIAGFLVAIPILVWGTLRMQPLPDAGALPPEGSIGFGASLVALGVQRLALGGTSPSYSVDSLYIAGWFGMLVTAMNLFPVGQLDGGHVAFAISRRLHRALSWSSIALLGVFVLGYVAWTRMPSVYTLWCVILLLLRDRHPPLGEPRSPLGRGRVAVAVAVALLFAVTFMPVPLVVG